ncbi:sensor histidine kinase [Clostridium septicum]|uniref:Sensor histidine kinase n=1 Tax=Clostridium septicum TaxID=1504 RepID=A0A9N7JK98_CLOSE|nr:sensor histidine kinase [Clostridium septicum]AYE33564.1 sensor histidine kinase [Clostridium septicum]QAS61727.1 sensor histidine kinase [Clostridium septicum]UEC21828.1 sensor histidine kinase [Clostridium septicum]USS00120.1 sensor histidine kinase [Clostridium septicum]
MFKNNYSFKKKLLMVFLLVGIIPLVLLWIYDAIFIMKTTYEKIEYYTKSNIEIASELIDNNINTYTKMVNYIAENQDIQKIINKEYSEENYSREKRFNDTQELYKIIMAILSTQNTEIPIHIVNLDKTSRFSTTDYYAPIYNDIRGDFYKKLDNNEDIAITQIHRRVEGKDSKDTVLVIGKAIVDKETREVIGYVIADIYDAYFDNIFKAISFVKGSNVMLLDDNGYIITDKNYKNSTGFKYPIDYLNKMNSHGTGTLKMNIDDVNYEGYYTNTKNTKIKVIELIPRKYFFSEVLENMKVLIILALVVITLCIIVVLITSKKMSKPIIEMTYLMKEVEKGNLDVSIENYSNDEIGELSRGFNDMTKELRRLIDEGYRKELLVQQAEFKALKSQVNPHFLYNSLGLVNWMARLGEVEDVIKATDALAKFFRYSVNNTEDIVPVKKEFEQIKSYLTIQNYRYKDKFTIKINVDENILDWNILKLILQPLVENAIIHGLEKKIGQGILIINAFEMEEKLCFEIKDNGVGIRGNSKKGEGIGISNVNKRIKLFYGEEFGVDYKREDEFTIFSIVVPKKECELSD